MAVETIVDRELTAEQIKQDEYDRHMSQSAVLPLELDTRYAVCLLRLHSTVDPSDYAAHKTAIEAVAGVQEITLAVDHKTDATVPSGKALTAVIDAKIRRDDA